jgi:predicted DCC family thiol-disulfide oxidoreductase YuxK
MSTSFLKNLFSFDLRSLALFRVGLALLILGDLIHRSFDLRAFYTDFGVLPRWVLMQNSDLCLSLHAMSGSLAFQVTLFLIAGCCALMLLIGYRTRLATVLSWVFIVSLHDRNFLILQGGDDLLRMLLFWGMFLPLGARWSVDFALAESAPPENNRHRSMGSIALGIQILLIYWTSAFYKLGQPVWLEDGAGIYYALHLDYLATQTGHWMREAFSMGTLSFLSYATLFAEFSVAALLVGTQLRSHWRLLAILIIVGLHVGFSLVLEVGIFPFVVFTALLAFVPTWFWEKTADWFQPDKKKDISIYYDADCSFCKKTVFLLRLFLGLTNATVKPAQSDADACALMEKYNSWVVIDGAGQKHLKFDAALVLFRNSSWPKALRWMARTSAVVMCLIILSSLAGSDLPDFLACTALLAGLLLGGSLLVLTLLSEQANAGFRFAMGTRTYEWVADHRELMGHFTKWLRWRSPALYPKTGASVIALLFIIYISLWNLNEMNNRFRFIPRLGAVLHQREHHRLANWVIDLNSKHTFMPESLVWIGKLSHVSQNWSMFDDPPKDDRWLVMPAKLADGSWVDLFSKNNGTPNFEKPHLPSSQYPRFRWRKFMENILSTGREEYLLRYGQFMCREWDRTHPPAKHLHTFEIIFVREHTTPAGPAPPEQILRWAHYCVEPTQPAPLPPAKNGE